MFDKIFKNISAQKQAERQAKLYRDFMRAEGRIGGEIFGTVPRGGRREFVCLDEHTWVWHEEWVDANGQRQVQTTRYDVRPSGIIKSQNGQYQNVSDQEAKHLVQAAHEYYRRIKQELYSFVA